MQKNSYIEIDLAPAEKALIVELASFLLVDQPTCADLANKRKKWVRFSAAAVAGMIGELSYHFNRCDDAWRASLLDALICHLEFYEART